MASSSEPGTDCEVSVSLLLSCQDFINLLAQCPTRGQLVAKSIGDEDDSEVIVEDGDSNRIIHIKNNQMFLSTRCQVLPETMWNRIMSSVSHEDNTNLAEVFTMVANLIRTFFISGKDIGQLLERLKLLKRCPGVTELVVKSLSPEWIKEIAKINPNLERIGSGDRFKLKHSKQGAISLRYNYIKQIWKIKHSVDTFKGPFPFHALSPSEFKYVSGEQYRFLTANMEKRIEFQPSFNYQERSSELVHVTEILTSCCNEKLFNLITQCPNLQLLRLHNVDEGWTTLPHNPSLKCVICSWDPKTMEARAIEIFLEMISNNTGYLDVIRFYRSIGTYEVLHIKNNLLMIRGDKIDGNKVPFSTSIRWLKKTKIDGKNRGLFQLFLWTSYVLTHVFRFLVRKTKNTSFRRVLPVRSRAHWQSFAKLVTKVFEYFC